MSDLRERLIAEAEGPACRADLALRAAELALSEAEEVAEGHLHSLHTDRAQDDELDKTARYSNSTVRLVMANIRSLAATLKEPGKDRP